MPRVSIVSVNEAVAALEIFSNILLQDKELPAYTSKVWQDISNSLSNKWSAHNVYINVREDRRKIFSQMKLNLNIKDDKHEKSNDTTLSSISSLNTTEESTNTTLDSTKENHNLSTFYLYITNEDWIKIKAGYIEYKDKAYGCLKPGVWSDVISDEFWRQFRLPCAYVFKRAKVYFSDKRSHFIIINGKCRSKSCGSSFNAYVDTEPKRGEHLVMRCVTKDTSTIPHEKVKRHLRFQKRQIVGKDLLAEGVSNWRRRIASQEMKIGDVEPPLLYESSVLRKVKQEYHDKTLNVDPKDEKDPIYSIRYMKHTSPYCGSIHEITLDKVCVHYRTPTQMHIYKEYCRKTTYRRIAMDATGSFVSKIQIANNLQSGHIFLYVIVINIEGLIIPVNEMISEKHDTNLIEYWIKEWLRMGANKPEEAISDYSKALLGAMTSAFNRMTIKEYVSACFSAINSRNTKINRLPNTYIRVDVAHLIKLVCRWKCFDKKHPDIKSFFVRCVALMISCQSFEKFESILLLTLTVSIQQYEGYYSTGLPSPAKEAKKILENHIATEIHDTNLDFDHVEFTDKREENDIAIDINDNENNDDDIYCWIEKLKMQAEINSDKKASRLNAFYLPEFYRQITRLCLEFPLWTGVSALIFNSDYVRATSAHCEAYFKDLREHIFKNVQTPMRADKFIKMHLRSIDGTMKIASAAIVTSNTKRTNIMNKNNKVNIDYMDNNINKESNKNEDMHQFENWMNKGKTEIDSLQQNEERNENNKLLEHRKLYNTRSNHKSKYFKPYPEIKHIKNNKLKKSTKKFLLRNGSFLQPLKINGTTYEIRNTCPFDSIAQIVILTALEDENYFNFISNSNNKFLKFCQLILNNGLNTTVYKERIAVLLDNSELNLSTTKAGNVHTHVIDIYNNITVMWTSLTKDEPCVNKISECSSQECQKEIHNISVLGVNHQLIQEKGFTYLEEALSYNFQVKNVKCQQSDCSGRRTEYVQFNVHLYIELDIRESLDAKTGMNCQLKDFPLTINILKQEYRLAGIIAYTNQHYIAYARRIHGTWNIYNDLVNSVQYCNEDRKIEPHGVIYIKI